MVGVLVLVFGIGQLVLPPIAAHVAKEHIEKYGKVKSVSIHAVPAIQLAWKHADSANVDVEHIKVTPKQATDLLYETKPITEVHMLIQTMTVKAQAAGLTALLPLREVVVKKHDNEIWAQGALLESDLRGALPGGSKVQPTAMPDGRLLMSVQSGFFDGKVIVTASKGALVLQPAESAETLPLFSERRISIDSVTARTRPGGETVTVLAHLR